MRKHFLILMLFALLPLASWAKNITNSVVGFPASQTYDATEQVLPDPITVDGEAIPGGSIVDVKWYKGTIATANEIQPTAGEYKFKDAGTYVMQFRINATGYEGVATGTYVVNKFTLTVTANSFNTAETQLTYGDEAPEGDYAFTYGPWPAAIEAIAVPADKAAAIAAETATISGTVEFASEYSKGMGVGDAYELMPVVTDRLTSNNYDFNPVAGTIKVVAKDFEGVGYNFTTTVAETQYKKAAVKPVPVVKDGELNQTVAYHVDGVDDDYELSYYTTEAKAIAGTDPATDAQITNVGTYWVRIAGKHNYKGAIVTSYKVTQKTLWITTLNGADENYDGAVIDVPTLAEYAKFEGLIGDDATGAGIPAAGTYKGAATIAINMKKGTTTYDFTDDAKKPIDAGDYQVIAKPSTNDLTAIFTNYKVIIENSGVHKIKPVALRIPIRLDLSKHIGETPALDVNKTYQPAAAEASDYFITAGASGITGLVLTHVITAYPSLTVAATPNSDGKYEVTGTWNNKLVIKESAAANAKTIANSNYTITVVPGLFTINKGQLAVRPVNKTITFGDAKAELTASAFGGEVTETSNDNTAISEFLKDALVISAKGLPFNPDGTVKTDATEEQKVDYPAAGVYTISFDLDEVDEATLNEWKGKYDIEYFNESTYTINKRLIKTITVNPQTLPLSVVAADDPAAPAALAAPSAGTIAFALADDDTYQLKDNDRRLLYNEIEFVYSPNVADSITGHKFVDQYKTYMTGIRVKTPLTMSNFKVEGAEWLVAGDLILTPDATAKIINRNDANFYTKYFVGTTTPAVVAAVFTDGALYDVKFEGDRLLKAETWTAMVLPFDITVAKLSNALGYAVVNTLASDATADNIKFTLKMGTIPANTPFLVKTAEEVDMNDVEIEGVTIEKPASADVTDGNASVKFHGVYDEITRAFTANELITANNKWYANYKNGMKPLAGYVERINPTTSAPMITVQDENGSTTAITAIQADGTAIAAEGWYTINGIRLEGAPTEKGVYVRNGKKIVIK